MYTEKQNNNRITSLLIWDNNNITRNITDVDDAINANC